LTIQYRSRPGFEGSTFYNHGPNSPLDGARQHYRRAQSRIWWLYFEIVSRRARVRRSRETYSLKVYLNRENVSRRFIIVFNFQRTVSLFSELTLFLGWS